MVSALSVPLTSQAKSEKAATVVNDAIWAHCLLYGTAVTTNSFKNPPPHTLDKLYNFDNSGLTGQRSVSESAPGDQDYNGGRWSIQAVAFTSAGLDYFDGDGDGKINFEMKSAEQVLDYASMGLLTISEAEVYFSCPLRGPGKSG